MRANQYDGVVMCPVHGSIQFFEHEKKVFSHFLFQRLRHIAQNDILSLVFPGATHTRFSHSIGAMHVSQKMWDGILNQNAIKRVSKKAPTRIEEEGLVYLNKCVRLAVLCHDLGHGAFSHQFENTRRIQDLLSGGRLFEALWKGVDSKPYYPEMPTEICHEHYSVRAAHKIFTDVDIEEDGVKIQDVLSIMETTEICVSDEFKDACIAASVFFTGRREWSDTRENIVSKMLNLLRCFISCEYDADKGDYLLRDAMFSGGNYGNYNLDAIVHNFSTAEVDGWFGLLLNRKGVGAIEDFTHGRWMSYRHQYNHKTSNGFELTLQMAIEEVMSDSEVERFVETCLSDIEKFGSLVDYYFWGKFQAYAANHPKSASASILYRKPMKFLEAMEDVSRDDINAARNRFSEALGVPMESIVANTSRIRFSNINDKYTTIMVRDEDTVTGNLTLKKISQISKFFEKFQNLELTQMFYCHWLDPSRSG